MNELSKIFKHLSRDLYVYFLTGFIVILDLLYLDYRFNNAGIYNYIRKIPYSIIYLAIISFVVGHIIFALMYCVFECSKIEELLKKKYFREKDENGNIIAFDVDYKEEMEIQIGMNILAKSFIMRDIKLKEQMLGWTVLDLC